MFYFCFFGTKTWGVGGGLEPPEPTPRAVPVSNKKITNHSMRKMLVAKLKKSGRPRDNFE